MQKPILFSTSMVRAILDGKKNQTRRIINPQPAMCNGCQSCEFRCDRFLTPLKEICSKGDTLWVRETWTQTNSKNFIYKADYNDDCVSIGLVGRWKPSIHMPKVACRIRLQVSDVRVERLKQISCEDAYFEGIERFEKNPVLSFQSLWESINGVGSWNINPWCWVISFKKA